MGSINFHLYTIVLEDCKNVNRYARISYDTFNDMESGDKNYNEKGVFYKVHIEKESQCLWLSFNYGSPNPRAETVINTKKGTERDNPRKEDEAEPKDQLFVLIKYDEFLYISDVRKKNFLKNFLEKEYKLSFLIKRIIISANNFIEKISQVEEISFTNVSDLFSQDNIYRNALTDLTGIDSPDTFTISAQYKGESVKTLKKFLNRIGFQMEKQGLSNSLTIKGIDERGFENIFNADSFSKKITIKLEKEKDGKFRPSEVKNQLCEIIL